MDWFASLLLIAGYILLIRKNFLGHAIMLVGNVIWASWWVSLHQLPAAILSVFFMGLNFWGLTEWKIKP